MGCKGRKWGIVITTKKGKYNQPLKLSLTSNITVENKPDIYKSRDYINSADYISLEKYLFAQGQYDGDLSDVYAYPVVSPVVEILSRERDGVITEQDANAQINALSKNDVRSDYEKYLYRKAVTQQYSLGLSGGSDKINYLVNGGFDDNSLSLVGNDTKRNTFFTAINMKPVKRLEINTSVMYTDSRSTYNGLNNVNPGYSKVSIYPYAKLADSAGNALPIVRDYRYGYIDTTGMGLLQDWRYRPLDEIKNQDITLHEQEILLRIGLAYTFDKHFSLEVKGQVERTNNDNRAYYNSKSYYARNLENLYTNIIDGSAILNIPGGGILDETYSSVSAYNLRGQLNYNNTLGKDHQVSFIAGVENRENKLKSQGWRTYGYDDNTLTYSNVDYVTNYNLYDNFGSNTIPDNASFAGILNRYLSIYGNGSYTYKNKYTLTSSIRKDASNLFGVNTNHKWNPFWSAGAAWKVSEEPFYKVRWLPYLNARITYGYSGNIDNGLSALAIIDYSSSARVTNLPYAVATQPNNPDLRWERTGTTNYGIDFGTRNNILSGSLEYYFKRSTDLLLPLPIDPTIGSQSPYLTENGADLNTKGIDVKLNGDVTFLGIKWQSQLLFSYVRSVVTKYQYNYQFKNAYIGGGYTISPLEGKDPYAIISYRWGGLDPANGDPQGYVNGVLSKDYATIVQPTTFTDLVVKGTSRPPYYSSFRNSFYYKGFGLSANVVYKWGYYFRRSALNYDALFNSWSMNVEYAQRWQKPGDEKVTNVPSLMYPNDANRDAFYTNSEATVEKGDNIRLQDIRISYDINLKRPSKISDMQLYLYFNNVGIIWRANKLGIDPDYGNGLPAPFSMSGGVKLNF